MYFFVIFRGIHCSMDLAQKPNKSGQLLDQRWKLFFVIFMKLIPRRIFVVLQKLWCWWYIWITYHKLFLNSFLSKTYRLRSRLPDKEPKKPWRGSPCRTSSWSFPWDFSSFAVQSRENSGLKFLLKFLLLWMSQQKQAQKLREELVENFGKNFALNSPPPKRKLRPKLRSAETLC